MTTGPARSAAAVQDAPRPGDPVKAVRRDSRNVQRGRTSTRISRRTGAPSRGHSRASRADHSTRKLRDPTIGNASSARAHPVGELASAVRRSRRASRRGHEPGAPPRPPEPPGSETGTPPRWRTLGEHRTRVHGFSASTGRRARSPSCRDDLGVDGRGVGGAPELLSDIAHMVTASRSHSKRWVSITSPACRQRSTSSPRRASTSACAAEGSPRARRPPLFHVLRARPCRWWTWRAAADHAGSNNYLGLTGDERVKQGAWTR